MCSTSNGPPEASGSPRFRCRWTAGPREPGPVKPGPSALSPADPRVTDADTDTGR
jgi:hypothetical protein